MRFSVTLLLIAVIFLAGDLYVKEVMAAGLKRDTLIVEVKGTDTDARFEPTVVNVQPGDAIKFMVREGLHTVTAYHPDNRRPLRIPGSATSFDSGPLQQDDAWVLQVNKKGMFDYFCRPHEKMGHAGRIISGSLEKLPEFPDDGIPNSVLKKLNTKTKNFLTEQH